MNFEAINYDMETAEFMLKGGRYFYAVFMCHLSIEKALKGLYYEKRKEVPPKTHNLIFLLREIGINPQESQGRFLVKLNEANIVTRYPEDLEILQRHYTKAIVEELIFKSKEALEWIKNQF